LQPFLLEVANPAGGGQLNSTLPAIPASNLLNYDSNGNTIFNGQQNVYDFENRLVQRGGVSIIYDG